VIDQLSKGLVFRALAARGGPAELLGGLLSFTRRRNSGGVFGVFQGSSTLFTILSVAALVLVGWLMWAWLVPKPRVAVGLALSAVLAGAVGNLIDRFWLGEVRDFIDIGIGSRRWPTFNVADIFVTVGAITLVLLVTFASPRKAERPEA